MDQLIRKWQKAYQSRASICDIAAVGAVKGVEPASSGRINFRGLGFTRPGGALSCFRFRSNLHADDACIRYALSGDPLATGTDDPPAELLETFF